MIQRKRLLKWRVLACIVSVWASMALLPGVGWAGWKTDGRYSRGCLAADDLYTADLTRPYLDNNGMVNFCDFWLWRLFTTIDPESENWNEAIDFNEDGVVSYADYAIFLGRSGDTAPFE